MLNKVVTYTLFPLLILLIMFLYGFSLHRNQEKNIKTVEVKFDGDNNHFLTHESVNKLLTQNDEEIRNISKSSLDLHRLEKQVLANPYVERANVFFTPGGLLKTDIKQRKPLARVITDDENYYVDKYGVKVPLSSKYSARVPLVLGVESSKDVEEVTQLFRLISEDDFLKKEIVAVQKNAEQEYFFDVRSGDYTINFGKYTNVGRKIKKIKAFYNKALFDKTIHKYKTINVKYHNQVVCTKLNQDGKQ